MDEKASQRKERRKEQGGNDRERTCVLMLDLPVCVCACVLL